jgi:hypothetical protein
MNPKVKAFLSSAAKSLWPVFLDKLRTEAVKFALTKLLKDPTAVDFRAWLIKFAVEEAIDDVAIPLANALAVEAQCVFRKVDGKVMVKRLKEATNANAYNSAADDIMS